MLAKKVYPLIAPTILRMCVAVLSGCGVEGTRRKRGRVATEAFFYELGFCNRLANKTLRNSFPPL